MFPLWQLLQVSALQCEGWPWLAAAVLSVHGLKGPSPIVWNLILCQWLHSLYTSGLPLQWSKPTKTCFLSILNYHPGLGFSGLAPSCFFPQSLQETLANWPDPKDHPEELDQMEKEQKELMLSCAMLRRLLGLRFVESHAGAEMIWTLSWDGHVFVGQSMVTTSTSKGASPLRAAHAKRFHLSLPTPGIP